MNLPKVLDARKVSWVLDTDRMWYQTPKEKKHICYVKLHGVGLKNISGKSNRMHDENAFTKGHSY
jgi:hypothetical protein